MTPDYDSMPAGQEMDALVHQKVFGRRVELRKSEIGRKGDEVIYRHYYYDPDDTTQYLHMTDGFTGMIPNYSTNIADAWKVVEWLMGDCQNSDLFIECWSDGEWFVASHPVGYSNREPTATCDGKTTGKPSLPLAICRWALKRES